MEMLTFLFTRFARLHATGLIFSSKGAALIKHGSGETGLVNTPLGSYSSHSSSIEITKGLKSY